MATKEQYETIKASFESYEQREVEFQDALIKNLRSGELTPAQAEYVETKLKDA